MSRSLGAGFPRGFVGPLSSTIFSLKSCSQSGKSCNRSLCTSWRPSFLFWFLVVVDSCCGHPRSSSFVRPPLSDPGVSTPLLSDTESLFADVDSCDEDDDEADESVVEEELAVIPRTKNGTHFLPFFDELRLFDLFSSGTCTHVLRRVSPMKALREFLEET